MGSLRQLFIKTRMRTSLVALLLSMVAAPALSTIVISTAAIAVPTGTVSAGLGTSLAALGLLKLKGAALLALSRTRRDVSNVIQDQEQILFLSVLKLEEDKCVRRFVCEVATGQLVAPEYMGTVKSLLGESLDSQIDSAKFVFSEAAKSGQRHGSAKKCQEKYTCPRTGADIYRAAINYGA